MPQTGAGRLLPVWQPFSISWAAGRPLCRESLGTALMPPCCHSLCGCSVSSDAVHTWQELCKLAAGWGVRYFSPPLSSHPGVHRNSWLQLLALFLGKLSKIYSRYDASAHKSCLTPEGSHSRESWLYIVLLNSPSIPVQMWPETQKADHRLPRQWPATGKQRLCLRDLVTVTSGERKKRLDGSGFACLSILQEFGLIFV